MKKKVNILAISIVSLFIVSLICLNLYVDYSYKKEHKEELKYFEGNIFSANEAANMIDALETDGNVIISPININASLAFFYNASDNMTKKTLESHFKESPENVNKIITEKLNSLNKEEANEYLELYNNLIKTFFKNKYNEYDLKSLESLNTKTKTKLLANIKKLTFLYNVIYKHENIDYKMINNYKVTKEDMKMTDENILDMIKNITNRHELLSFTNVAKNYNLLYLNNIDIHKEFLTSNKNVILTNKAFSEKQDLIKQVNEDIKKYTNNNTSYYLNEENISDMLSINTLYYNYLWHENYTNSNVKEGLFFTENNERVVEYMYSTETKYLENEYAKGFKKDFYNKKFSFIGILPKEKGTYFLSNLNIESLINSNNKSDCLVALPKFKITYESNIEPILKALKVSDITLKNANFKKMTNEKITLNYYKQKITLNITQNGTFDITTKEQNLETFSVDDTSKALLFNRPFSFLIINNETNDILFIGKINNL